MSSPQPRRRTGNDHLDEQIDQLLDEVRPTADRDQLFEILASATLLAGDGAHRLDLKITNAALQEMRAAFHMFAPYRDVPKVTIFGSARTAPDDPLYAQAKELAAELAKRGWMVVTGAGPGIMAAGMEGAGRENAIGVLIRLPFEGGANPVILGDDKLIEMKYFFTRKLMLIKESAAFVALPGGFGTLDETFELLTLVQTGKAEPVPIVLLDTPGGSYWDGWQSFVDQEVAGNAMISRDDFSLYHITDSVEGAVAEIERFYRNFHSLRYVGDRLVVRLHAAPTRAELRQLSTDFADIVDGPIERSGPFPPEVSSKDHLELRRLAMRFDRHGFGRLRSLIDALNSLDSAPERASHPPTAAEEDRLVDEHDAAG